jgi:hypothetical protein
VKFHEDKEQEVVFEWASYYPELRWMHSIPNGSHLAGNPQKRAMQMARLKKQGLRTGVSDIFLPMPSCQWHGLYIEMKRRKVDGPSKISKDQLAFIDYATEWDYSCVVAYGAEEAIDAVKAYLMW